MRTLFRTAGIAFLLGVLAHIESLGFWFTSYDSIALIETSRISSFGDLWLAFTTPLMAGTTYTNFGLFYRPVVNLTYAVEYWLWGLNPFGYHLTNLLLHGLAGALVVVTVYLLTDSMPTGTLSGVLFAIHPLSTDTIPAISRRQDVLLTIFGLLTLWLFVKGVRRSDARLRAGATVAYALALLSKETAIMIGPLAFLWVVFQQPSLRKLATYRRALSAVLPLAIVAIAYLAVRVAVLGGIGGYTHDPPLAQVVLFPLQYVLSLTYQAHLFGVIREFSPFLLVVITVGVPMLYLLSFLRDRPLHNVDAVSFLFVAIAVAGFATLTTVLVIPAAFSSLTLYNVRTVGWYAVGIVFTTAAVSTVLAALSSRRALGTEDRRLNAFFLVWLVIPLPLFFIAQQFAFRNAYFFVIPFLALLTIWLMHAVSYFERQEVAFLSRDTDIALMFAVLVLLAPTLAASPLLYSDSGWGDSSDVARQALARVNSSMSETDANTRVVVDSVPTRIRHHPRRLGQARKVTMLQPHSVRSWLKLQGHKNPVATGRLQSFITTPENVSATVNHRNGNIIVHIHYLKSGR